MKVEITDINVTLTNEKPVLAYVDLTLNNVLKVYHIRVVRGTSGALIVAMPSRRFKDGQWKDLMYFSDYNTRMEFISKVLEVYNEEESKNTRKVESLEV